ncbi:MAG TPA: hypothetical protein VGP04_03020 [Pseudonocardiaceae bacterium]|jgi:hypothetical protein|nr:hypothetical protein [Pseudonocardiaceae bacterium]
MRRSSEPEERAQFTVAELLARYGDPAPTAGRRHRRAADDVGIIADTAAQPDVPPNGADRREPTLRQSGPLLATDAPVRHRSPGPEPTWAPATRRDATQSESTSTQPNLNGGTRRDWAPAVGTPSVATTSAPLASPAVARRAPLTRTAFPDGSGTDQLPRFDPVPAYSASWPSRPAVRSPARSAPPASAPPASAQPPAGLGAATRAVPEQKANSDFDDEIEDAQAASPLWEWAAMVSQIGIGVVGGATLWLICEWLWQRIPVLALVVALAVITGLVWIVRRVRRAEDLQTTVIAVLVGLFVTVSPAALLLVGR